MSFPAPVPRIAPIITCPACRHWGDVLASECPFCRGSRRVYLIVSRPRPCALCQGTGAYHCDACGGSGCDLGSINYEAAPSLGALETIHGGIL